MLSSDEIRSFWKGLNDASRAIKIGFKVAAGNRKRKGEIVLSKWKEFDLTND